MKNLLQTQGSVRISLSLVQNTSPFFPPQYNRCCPKPQQVL